MADADALVALGLFAIKGFLEAELCARLRAEAEVAARRPATLVKKGVPVVDEQTRKGLRVDLTAAAASLIQERLISLMPAVGGHFGLSLTRCQPPQLLFYRRGDHFRPHQDAHAGPSWPDFIRARKVSLVAFLNSESARPAEGCYGGGSLAFFKLVEKPTWDNCRVSLRAEAGLLIAFRSDVFHEVSPVTHGERYTLVSWFA